MTVAELDQLMAESTRQFNDLKVEEGSHKARLEEIDTGLKQLQGEYEAYNTLRTRVVAEEAPKPADTIFAPEAEAVAGKPAKKEVVRAAK